MPKSLAHADAAVAQLVNVLVGMALMNNNLWKHNDSGNWTNIPNKHKNYGQTHAQLPERKKNELVQTNGSQMGA
jgi:hypothetical protein